MPLIFQYGSNCNRRRLNHATRLAGDAKDARAAQTVGEYEIAFNKWSEKNACAATDLIKPEAGGRRVWGVVYMVSDHGLKKLAEDVEGQSYEPTEIEVEDADGEVRCVTTFVVKTHKRREGLWTTVKYVRHIIKGLRDRSVPEEYTQHVIDAAIATNSRVPGKAAKKATAQSRLIEALHIPDRQPLR